MVNLRSSLLILWRCSIASMRFNTGPVLRLEFVRRFVSTLRKLRSLEPRVISLILFNLFAQRSISAQPADSFSFQYEKSKQELTWDSPAAREQADLDEVQIPFMKGALFVPTMSNPAAEPQFVLFKDHWPIGSYSTGQRILLDPGDYSLQVGPGQIQNRVVQPLAVHEGNTTVVLPAWGGLTMQTVDENKTPVKEYYQIFSYENQENIGIGFGVAENLSSDLKTWFLKPGLYKVVSLEGNFNSYTNFTTVAIFPGQLAKYTLVIDSKSKQILGAGILDEGARFRGLKNWKLSVQWGGSVFYLDSRTRNLRNLTFGLQSRTILSLNTLRHRNTTRINSIHNIVYNEGNLQILGNDLEFRNLYIYWILPRLGIYLRGTVLDNILPEKRFLKQGTTYYYQKNGVPVAIDSAETFFVTTPAFFPLDLEEGSGLTIEIFKRANLDLNLLFGIGVKQKITDDRSYLDLNEGEVTFRKMEDFSEKGYEALIQGEYRFRNSIIFISDNNIFMPKIAEIESWSFNLENTVRFILSRFVFIDASHLYRTDAKLKVVTEDEFQIKVNLIYNF